jgi:hypothetical protein
MIARQCGMPPHQLPAFRLRRYPAESQTFSNDDHHAGTKRVSCEEKFKGCASRSGYYTKWIRVEKSGYYEDVGGKKTVMGVRFEVFLYRFRNGRKSIYTDYRVCCSKSIRLANSRLTQTQG